MNREQKRAMQKAGQLGPDGEPVSTRERRTPPPPKTKEERTSARQFLKEVRAELKKVAWPTRQETIKYSVIVFITVVVLTAFILTLDFAFSEFVDLLFDTAPT